MDSTLIEDFAELFQGRTDKYGRWIDEDAWADDSVFPWYQYVEAHLEGGTKLGVYPQTDDGMVRWGCSDFDDENALVHATNLVNGFQHLGITAWLEVSRSKGYHVWVFAYHWVPAQTMRNAFLAVHQALGIPAKEVNPKQILGDGTSTYGNWVRLPYPGPLDDGLTATGRQMMVRSGTAYELDDFVTQALEQRVSEESLEMVADLYKPPPPPEPIVWEPPSADWMERLNKNARSAVKYGPKPGHDRSSSLARLAHECRDSGLTASEAYHALVAMDIRPDMRKFIDRVTADREYERLVENAYG